MRLDKLRKEIGKHSGFLPELASKSGVSLSTLRKVLYGTYKSATLTTVEAIEAGLLKMPSKGKLKRDRK